MSDITGHSRPLKPKLLLAWTSQTLAHDVKPGNILLTDDGHAKVSDMGLSRAEFFSSLHAFAGTFAYAAPEVLLGHPSHEKVGL